MPQYTYQCKCGLRFEAAAPMKEHKKPQPCPDCRELAPRWVPEDIHGAFSSEVSGPVPQNTGASSVDTDYDRAIGTSAKQGWGVQERRYREKTDIIRSQGVEGADLSRNPDGTYRVLDPKEKGVFERGNTLHRKVMEIRETLKKQEEGTR